MSLIIQKYGGTSVASLAHIQRVAEKILQTKRAGHQVVVVVSAMAGETDRLIDMANSLVPKPDVREYDVLVSSGEQVSMALLSMALIAKDCPARSFTGSQAGIKTNDKHSKACVVGLQPTRLYEALRDGYVVIVAGFQGSNTKEDITTLGRGGSDATAVALAAALGADECQIYTDVDGVYTTDPRIVPTARKLERIDIEEMLEMSALGAKVLQMQAVELAYRHQIPIRVLSTFHEGTGTLVTCEENRQARPLITGIACNRQAALMILTHVPKRPGIEGFILGKINEADIDADMITDTIDNKTMRFTFALHRKDAAHASVVLQSLSDSLGATFEKTLMEMATLSLVGTGIPHDANVTTQLFKTLETNGIPLHMVTTSEIKISLVIPELQLDRGVHLVHDLFQLSYPTVPSACLEVG